jgi:hypothetical protein
MEHKERSALVENMSSLLDLMHIMLICDKGQCRLSSVLEECPANWKRFGNACYYLNNNASTFQDAV